MHDVGRPKDPDRHECERKGQHERPGDHFPPGHGAREHSGERVADAGEHDAEQEVEVAGDDIGVAPAECVRADNDRAGDAQDPEPERRPFARERNRGNGGGERQEAKHDRAMRGGHGHRCDGNGGGKANDEAERNESEPPPGAVGQRRSPDSKDGNCNRPADCRPSSRHEPRAEVGDRLAVRRQRSGKHADGEDAEDQSEGAIGRIHFVSIVSECALAARCRLASFVRFA